MLENLSDEQEELILAGVQAVAKNIQEKEGEIAYRQFMEKLSSDENMLKRFSEMLDKYRNKNHMGSLQRGGGHGGGQHNNSNMQGGGPNYPHIY